MTADIPSVPMPETLLERRIALDQIDALFNAITVSVCGAAIAAGVLVAALLRLGAVNAWTGLVWSSYIVFCAACHILLCRAYRRSRPVGDHWRVWALWFTMISLAEGIGWGWASIGLATAPHSDAKLLVFLIVGGVAAATVPGFSPYRPAFFAIFLPIALGAMAASSLSADPVQQAASPAILVFIGVMGAVSVKANKEFKQFSGLRIRTEILAQDLHRQKEIAEQASLAKSTFLAAASHDLRQPVHAMGLFVGALRSVPMPPQGQRLLEQLEQSINAMDGLFSAILDISRLDARIVEVHRRCFAIGPLLDRICRDYEEEARVKELSLTCKYSSVIIESDPVLVERILRNLISNAVRYTSQGRIVVGCRRRGATVLVQVWDTGRGIPADQQNRVFQEYYQLDNPERDRTKGLGLGLAIVRRLTELLDCKLRLRSQPARGSCFEVAFPLAGDTTGVIELQPQAFSGVLAQGLIIVIDDELAIRQAMSSLLTGWGYNVVAAGSGEEAIQVLLRFPAPPDLVICDYRLRNDENGIEVIARLRSEFNETIPAMLITGDTAPDRLAEAKLSGLLLLHKPLSNAKLRAAIVNLARKTEPSITTVSERSPVR
jgi:signal transduction histidine kinase/CheY-like chemotaxis protein